MTPPTIEESIALYQSVPSIVANDGDATIKQRAQGIEILRQSDDSWNVFFNQVKSITLASGEVIPLGIGRIQTTSTELTGETVTIPANHEMVCGKDFTISGTLVNNGQLHIL